MNDSRFIFSAQSFLLIFILLFSSVSGVAYAKKATTFVFDGVKTLEARVRQKHGIEQLAKDIADLRGFESWSSDKDPDLKLYVAIDWLNGSNLAEAKSLLLNIDRDQTDSDLWDYHMAKAFLLLHEPSRSLELIARLEEKHARDLDLLKLKASYLAEKGDLPGAIELMNAVLSDQKKDGDAYLQRGAYHVMAFSTDMAIEDFKLALKKLPKHEIYKLQQSYLQLGVIYYKVKLDKKQAGEYLKKGVELDPNSELVRQVTQVIQANYY